MEKTWKLACLCLVTSFSKLCNGLPIYLERTITDPHIQVASGLIAIVLAVCTLLLLGGCLCCQRRRGFKEFRDSPVAISSVGTVDNGLVNPTVDGAFTIFAPLTHQHFSGSNDRFHAEDAYIYGDINVSSWFNEGEADFPRAKLKYIREVGKGWFGRVVEGTAQDLDGENTRTPVIVRILDSTASSKERVYFLHEAEIYRCGDHTNILKLYGRCLDSVPLLLLQEYCSQDDLKSYLLSNKSNMDNLLASEYPLIWCCQITSALKFLHEKGLAHSDLACRNCQLTSNLTLKLGDYGLASVKYPEDYYEGIPTISVRWCAPESIRHTNTTIQSERITREANVWSLAVCFWEICECGEIPYRQFSDDEVVTQVLGKGNVRLPRPSHGVLYTDYIYRLMQSCWLTPESRPTSTQIYLTLTDLLQVFTVCKAESQDSMGNSQGSRESFDMRWNSLKPNNLNANDSSADILNDAATKPMSPSLNNLIGSLEDMNRSRNFDDDNAHSALLSAKSQQKFEFELGPQSKEPLETDSLNDSMIFTTQRSSSSETEEENWKTKIERGAYTEKVRQKSRSVTDLMVLTHIDCSESESETPLPSLDHRVNYKNVRLAPKHNLESLSYVHGSEGNLLNVQDDFQAELKKLQEEHRDSLFFVPDKYSQSVKHEQINDNLEVEENSSLVDSSSERLFKELNSTSEMKPVNQVFNVFNVTIDNFSPVHIAKLNEIINLEEPIEVSENKTFIPYEVPKLCDIIQNNSNVATLTEINEFSGSSEVNETFLSKERWFDTISRADISNTPSESCSRVGNETNKNSSSNYTLSSYRQSKLPNNSSEIAHQNGSSSDLIKSEDASPILEEFLSNNTDVNEKEGGKIQFLSEGEVNVSDLKCKHSTDDGSEQSVRESEASGTFVEVKPNSFENNCDREIITCEETDESSSVPKDSTLVVGGSLVPNDSTLVPRGDIAESSSVSNDSTPVTCENVAESSSVPNDSTPVQCGNIAESSLVLNYSTPGPDEHIADSSSVLHDSTLVPVDNSVLRSSVPNDSTPVACKNVADSSAFPNDLTLVLYDNYAESLLVPNQAALGSGEDIADNSSVLNDTIVVPGENTVLCSSVPNDTTLVPHENIAGSSLVPNESELVHHNNIADSTSDLNDSTMVPCENITQSSSISNDSRLVPRENIDENSLIISKDSTLVPCEMVGDSSSFPNVSTLIPHESFDDSMSVPNDSTIVSRENIDDSSSVPNNSMPVSLENIAETILPSNYTTLKDVDSQYSSEGIGEVMEGDCLKSNSPDEIDLNNSKTFIELEKRQVTSQIQECESSEPEEKLGKVEVNFSQPYDSGQKFDSDTSENEINIVPDRINDNDTQENVRMRDNDMQENVEEVNTVLSEVENVHDVSDICVENSGVDHRRTEMNLAKFIHNKKNDFKDNMRKETENGSLKSKATQVEDKRGGDSIVKEIENTPAISLPTTTSDIMHVEETNRISCQQTPETESDELKTPNRVKVYQVPKLIDLIENNDVLMDYIIANYESELHDDLSCENSYKTNSIHSNNTVVLKNDEKSGEPEGFENVSILDFDLSETQEVTNPNSLTHLNIFSTMRTKHKSLDLVSSTPTKGSFSSLREGASEPETENTNLNYSLETWDNFLGHAIDCQNQNINDQTVFESMNSEPQSLIFIESDERKAMVTPPNSDMEVSLEDQPLADVYENQTINIREEDDGLNGTFIVEEGVLDKTYSVSELNATYSKEDNSMDGSEGASGTWESNGGWFLHPQSSCGVSGQMTEQQDAGSYVRFGMDDEILAALRGELLAKLPHAQGSSSDKLKDNEEEWDSIEKDEVFLRYNVYNTPLSPILEESENEEDDGISNCTTTPGSPESGASDDWPEKFFGAAAPQDNESQSLKAQGLQQQHTLSQDSCCSNDTLFNLEDMTCVALEQEKQLSSSDEFHKVDKEEDETRLSEEQIINEAINYFKNGTSLGVPLESPVTDLESPMEALPDKTYLSDFLCKERKYSESVAVVVTETHSDTQSDSNSSKNKHVAPLPSPDDHPWKQLSASLLDYDRSQKKGLMDLGIEETEDVKSETVVSTSEKKDEDIVHDYENIPVDRENEKTEPDYTNINEKKDAEKDSTSYVTMDVENQPDYANINEKENVEKNSPSYVNVKVGGEVEAVNTLYENIENVDDILNEADYVNITNLENRKIDAEFTKEELTEVNEKSLPKYTNTVQDGNDFIIRDMDAEEDDEMFGVLTDIRFSGPGESHLMSTSFSESNDLNNEQDWDSGSDTRSSSSGEFIWKEGEHEESLKALQALPQDPLDDVKLKEGNLDQTSSDSNCSDEEGECPEFIPSAWDKYATPTKSALRSPEKTLEKEEKKKGVWFKKQRYHCVYEYPREPDSPVLQSFDLWNNPPPVTAYPEWYFDIDSSAEYSEFSTTSNLSDAETISTDFNTNFDNKFFVTSSATPFDMMEGNTSQFFPGSDHWSETSKLNENTTPDSGVEDITPGSMDRVDFGGIETSLMVPSLKFLAETAYSKLKQKERDNRSSEILGGLRHTRDKLKLDLPPSPNTFTANKTFNLEPNSEPVVLRERPSFTTFGKSRFLVQHVDTPDRDTFGNNVCFEALPYKPPENKEAKQKSKKIKKDEDKGEASLLDSADEDSGIESSTLERKSGDIVGKLIEDL